MVARTRNRKPTAAIVETSGVEIEEDKLIGNTDPLDDLDTETDSSPSNHTSAVASDKQDNTDPDFFDDEDDDSTDEDELDLEGDGLDGDEDGGEDSSDADEDDSTGETDEEYMQRLLTALREEMGVVMEAPVLEHILGVADFVNDFRRRHLAE